MKPSPLSPEWRKKRQKMAFFNKQELKLKRRIKNMNRKVNIVNSFNSLVIV